MTSRRVVVVGGGVTGLTAAFRLVQEPGTEVTLLEASRYVGGKVSTQLVSGLALDAGAESVLGRRPEFRKLVQELGMTESVITPSSAGVEVLVKGQRRTLPRRQLLGIPYDFDDLAASDMLDDNGMVRARQDLTSSVGPLRNDMSVGELVRTRMGDQVLDRLVEPLLAGVYAANADQVSVDVAIPGLRPSLTSEGSLAAAIRSIVLSQSSETTGFISVRGGLAKFAGKLADSVQSDGRGLIVSDTRVTGLQRRNGGWRIESYGNETPQVHDADAVLIATPSAAAAVLLANVNPLAAKLLNEMEYASVVLTTLVFDAAAAPAFPEGSGMLIAPSTGLHTKAVTYSSQKWAWVRDDYPNNVVVRLSMGRSDDERALALSDAEVVDVGCAELAEILHQSIKPDGTAVMRWNQSIPQYRVGHHEYVTRVREAVLDTPGLVVAGAALDGVGIPSCIASAQHAATQLLRYLSDGQQ